MAKNVEVYCKDRKPPYQLFWIEGGVRHSRFFETEVVWDDFLRLNRLLYNGLLRFFEKLTQIQFLA